MNQSSKNVLASNNFRLLPACISGNGRYCLRNFQELGNMYKRKIIFFVFLWEAVRYEHMLTMIIMLKIIEYRKNAILTLQPHCDRKRAIRETTLY